MMQELRRRTIPDAPARQDVRHLASGELLISTRKYLCERTKRWLMSFGSDVEVIEPLWLREEIKARHEHAFSQYEGSP